MIPLVVDKSRELSHARFSPDGTRITFTRHNKRGLDGLAVEDGRDYRQSEIVLVSASGSGEKVLKTATSDGMSANSSWIDNDTIVYVHRQGLDFLPQLRTFSLVTGKDTILPTPKGLAVSDPHVVDGTIVFVVIATEPGKFNSIWKMDLCGSRLERLTNPQYEKSIHSRKVHFNLGDYDPCISFDKKQLVFMRYYGDKDWKVISLDLDTGFERKLFDSFEPAGIPRFSVDADRVIFVSWKLQDLSCLGLYLLDCKDNQVNKIALPGGFLYTHPSFSTIKESKGILFSARRVPGLPGRAGSN